MSEPVARVFVHKTGGNVGIRWSGVPVDGAPLMHDGELLYTADAICEAVEAAHARMISDGWRQCAQGQRTTQFCGQLQKAVEAEREACAKVCEEMDHDEPRMGAACAAAIRARSSSDEQ